MSIFDSDHNRTPEAPKYVRYRDPQRVGRSDAADGISGFRAAVPLDDGAFVHLRNLGPADREVVVRLYQGLSSHSRYCRFHCGSSRLSETQLRLLTSIDGRLHVAIGAWSGCALIGIAHFVRTADDGTEAEVAFTVADVYQGRGLGRHMRYALARVAASQGVERFTAMVLSDNHAALRLLFPAVGETARFNVQLTGTLSVSAVIARGPAAHSRNHRASELSPRAGTAPGPDPRLYAAPGRVVAALE